MEHHDEEPEDVFGDGPELVVDLSDRSLWTQGQLWKALRRHLDLPEWFGDNLDAWNDTLNNGGISSRMDQARHLRFVVRARGVFAANSPVGSAFESICTEEGRASVTRVR